MAGTTSTDPSQVGSKVKLPKATGPEPSTRTWSSTAAPSKSSRSHFSPAVNLSSPAGRVIRAASPQPDHALAVPDPGQRGRPGQPGHQIARVGDRDAAHRQPVRRQLVLLTAAVFHACQLYVAPAAGLAAGGGAEPSRGNAAGLASGRLAGHRPAGPAVTRA